MRLVICAILMGVGLSGAVYAWGAGAFAPCEVLGRLVASGLCTSVTDFEGRSVQAIERLPNGNLLVVTRQSGSDPILPHLLVEIDPETGRILAETEFEAIDPRATWIKSAINLDGSLVAASILDGPTRVFGRNGNLLATLDIPQPSFLGFDEQDRLLVERGQFPEGVPQMDAVLVFDPFDPERSPAEVNEPASRQMFTRGIQTVVSSDGTVFAQALYSGRDTGIVGVRVGDSTQPSRPGAVLAAQLATGCSYNLPTLAFSPDGSKLAAEFDCAQRWAETTSALVVWEINQARMLVTIPTKRAWRNMLWLDDQSLVIERYDRDARRSELRLVTLG